MPNVNPYIKEYERVHTISHLFQLGQALPPTSIFNFMGVVLNQCPGYVFNTTDRCNTQWAETVSLRQGIPSRQEFLRCVFQAEQLLKDFFHTPVGPEYITEDKIVSGWHDLLYLDCTNVAKTNTRTDVQVFEGLPIVVTRFNKFYPSAIEDMVRIEIGDGGTPLLGFDTNFALHIYHQDIPEWEFRPFEIVSYDNVTLTLEGPSVSFVEPSNLFVFPDANYNLPPLNFCGDILVDASDLIFFQESYSLLSGKAFLDTTSFCSCQDAGVCAACTLREVDICLIPKSPERGIFTFRPLINTGTEEEPCWEIDYSLSGYPYHLDYLFAEVDNIWKACYNKILSVQVNYTAGFNCKWGDTYFPQRTDEKFLDAVVYLASSCFDPSCDCACTKKWFEEQQIDSTQFRTGDLKRSLPFEEMWTFGRRSGQITAYERVRHLKSKKLKAGII